MQPQSLGQDRAILSNVIRQEQKIRVGEGGGFMLVIERTSIPHRPSRVCVPLGPYPLGTAEATGSALLSGRWKREFQGPCFFFCSLLLRSDLLAKKVPGRAPYSQHIMIRNWT